MYNLLPVFCLFYFLTPLVSSTCAFTQTCNNAEMGDCNIPTANISEPRNYTYTEPFQCPEFLAPNNTLGVCCNDDQNTLMKNNFNLLRYTFGSGANGCDLCAVNLMRFWCNFGCSPNQTNFVQTNGDIIVPSPFNPAQNLTVLNVTFKIDPDMACDMFHSCKKTPYVSQVSAMSSAQGLLNFLGSNAVATGLEKINMVYTNNVSETPLNLMLHGCNESYYLKDQYGYPVWKNCTCNSCDSACGESADLSDIIKPLSALQGFNTYLVVGFYIALAVETVLCFIGRRFSKMKRTRQKSRNLFVPEENQHN